MTWRRAVRGFLTISSVLFATPFEGGAQPKSPDGGGPPKGEAVYRNLCASCHGRYGRGDGPAAADLAVPLPDFTDSALLANRSDEEIEKRLRANASHTPMAPAAALREGAFLDAIAYVRTLSVPGKHVSLLAGRDIYNGSCWVCHGPEGNGKGPAARNVSPPPRDFTSPEFRIEGREDEVARVITEGAAAAIHGSAYMPEWGTRLSPQQIRDVMEYLKTFRRPGS
jgi:mono/diheme cytochrome c family protein